MYPYNLGLSFIPAMLLAAPVIEIMSTVLLMPVHVLMVIPRYLMTYSALAYGTNSCPTCNLGSTKNHVLLEVLI